MCNLTKNEGNNTMYEKQIYFYSREIIGFTEILKKISSSQLFSNFVSKTITFTNFLPKKSERVTFRYFKNALYYIQRSLALFGKNFVKAFLLSKEIAK